MVVEVLLALLMGATVLMAVWFFGQRGREGSSKVIPGWNKPPSDPKLGDLGLAVSSGSLQEHLILKHEGGSCPVVAFWWKKERVVSVCSQQAFKDTENLYNRPRVIFAPCFEPLHGSRSIQSINDAHWREKKKQLHGTIRGKNLESFFPEFVAIVEQRKALWVPRQPLQLKNEMFKITLAAILNTSLGRVENDSDLETLIAAYDSCKCNTDKRILDIAPPNDQQESEFQKTLKHLQEEVKKLLHSRMNAPKNGETLPLLDALIESGDPEDEIVSNMITFIGGFHTSGYYGMWIFLYLAKHPGVQEKLFQEMKERVDGDTGEKLKAYTQTSHSYLRQVLDEIFRLSSTAAFAAHFANEDILVEGYHIPAKTPIIHAIGVAMQNGALWENPEAFEPDRFAPGSKHSKRGHEFRPFGVSCTRRCPANHFIYQLTSICVTILVQHFAFFTCADEDEVVKKKYGTATSPSLKEDIHIHVELRKPMLAEERVSPCYSLRDNM